MDSKRHEATVLIYLLLTLLPATASRGEPMGDRLVVATTSQLLALDLPKGDFEVVSPVTGGPFSLAFTAEGMLWALHLSQTDETYETFLFNLDEVGQASDFSRLDLLPGEYGADLAFTADGRLFVLTQGLAYWNPPSAFGRLIEVDPADGTLLSEHIVADDIHYLAPSSRGFWLVANDRLDHFDTLSGVVEPADFSFGDLGVVVAADSDSSGALWMVTEPGFIDPPPFSLLRFDPATGALYIRPGLFEPVGPMAIERRCQPGQAARCLLGGRFRATVSWRDFDDRFGAGQVAPSGSADSALFWFFEPSNWELLVKVIDGCNENGHYWVFAAGTTNVEHTLQVDDLLTGEIFSTTNALGQASAAITATDAFANCP